MVKEIVLPRGYVVTVDDEDFDLVSKFKWSAKVTKNRRVIYAYGWIGPKELGGKPRKLSMHRLLMNEPECDVDHIDMNGLNNCRTNLRLATQSENQGNQTKHSHNTSGRKGVWTQNKTGKFIAEIIKDWKKEYLGAFDDVDDAARAYDAAAVRLFGEFARLNFPDEIPDQSKYPPLVPNELKTHCPNGHEYLPETTRLQTRNGTTGRSCKLCHRIKQKDRYHAKKKKATEP